MKNHVLTISLFLTVFSCRAQQINRPTFLDSENPSIEKIQQAISYNLYKAQYYRFKPVRIPRKFLKPDYFTEEHRERIADILQNKWREDELESHLKASMESILDTINPANGLYENAKKIATLNRSSLSSVWDSIVSSRKFRLKKSFLESKKVPDEIIKIAGYLKDQRFTPYLMEIIERGPSHIEYLTKLSLARLQIEPFHGEMIERHKYSEDYVKGLNELSFICSKEAIDEILVYTKDNIARYGISDVQIERIDYVAEGAIHALSFIYKNNEMAEELRELEISEFKLDADWYFPKTLQDLEKMRMIMNKYYENYSMTDIDCDKVYLDLGW